MSEDNGWLRNCCNNYCTVREETETYWRREELLKIRQKRPALATPYRMERIRVSHYQKAMRDLTDINTMIDLL